mgnify:CR=1 FL=1
MKKTIIFLFLLYSISVLSASTIGYWRFEEGSNNVAASGTNSVIDQSGYNNHGTPSGPIYKSFTPNNNVPYTLASNNLSLQFDGLNDYVNVGNSSVFNITQTITLEAWFYPQTPANASGATYDSIVTKGGLWDYTSSYQLYYDSVNDAVRGFIRWGTNKDDHSGVSYSIAQEQWIHAALTLDEQGKIKLYINGVLKTANSLPDGKTMLSNSHEVWIGATSTNQSGREFTGNIDEVRISDIALAPDQFLNGIPEPNTIMLLFLTLTIAFVIKIGSPLQVVVKNIVSLK